METFFLSILSKEKLEKLNRVWYKHAKQYSKDNNTQKGLNEWEMFLTKHFIVPQAEIVMIAAGGGREIYALHKIGYRCRGYEADKTMINYSNLFFQNENINTRIEFLAANQIPKCKCDVFWFGWGVYSHFIGEESRIELLQNAKDTLRENGKIIISYWATNNNIQKRIRLINHINNKWFKKLNRFSKRDIEVGDSLRIGCFGKYFTYNQIMHEAEKAGLKIIYISDYQYGHAVLTPI